jgi:hypothetical protein
VWGDVEDTRLILLDGHEFPITENLWQVLQRLRRRSLPVILWADGICINQSDTNEKGLQVPLMTEIYTKAYSVAIWLGPQADNSHMAVDLMHEIVAAEVEGDWLVKEIIHSRTKLVAFQALAILFRREYWNRVWVVQEVANGSDITVYCGNIAAPFSLYADASKLFSKYNTELVRASREAVVDGSTAPVSRGSTGLFNWSNILSTLGPGGLRNPGRGMLNALLFHRDKHCSDPRDKVYGLLGILSLEERDCFGVDYNISMNEVYTNVVHYLLTTTRRLDVLCASIHIMGIQTTSGLPSWVPDWSYYPVIEPIGRMQDFCASGKSDVDFRFSNRRKSLEISGIVLDNMRSCGIALGSLTSINEMRMAFLEWRSRLIQGRGYDVAVHESFCRTLCMNMSNDGPRELMESTYHAFAILLQELPSIELDSQLKFYASTSVGSSATFAAEMLFNFFHRTMAGRRFCMTFTGLLCLGSSSCVQDDIVIVPLGCSTPIILRKRNQTYTYIGDIYVDGYMYGRAIDELNSGVRQLQNFVLE